MPTLASRWLPLLLINRISHWYKHLFSLLALTFSYSAYFSHCSKVLTLLCLAFICGKFDTYDFIYLFLNYKYRNITSWEKHHRSWPKSQYFRMQILTVLKKKRPWNMIMLKSAMLIISKILFYCSMMTLCFFSIRLGSCIIVKLNVVDLREAWPFLIWWVQYNSAGGDPRA